MSIDLVLWATNKPSLLTFAKANNLWVDDGNGETSEPDPETGETSYTPSGNFIPRDGLEHAWWNGSGKLMLAKGTYDAEGVELTAPNYASGIWVLLRIHSDFFETDKLTPAEDDVDRDEAWARSKVARYIKNNGTAGTAAGLTYYTLDGVRIFKYADVQAELLSRGVAGHSFL